MVCSLRKLSLSAWQGMALALAVASLAAWLLWDWLQHRLRSRERELANNLTQDLDVDSIKRLVGEVRHPVALACAQGLLLCLRLLHVK